MTSNCDLCCVLGAECSVELVGEHTVLQNPGRFDVSKYPNAVICTYLVHSGTDKPINYVFTEKQVHSSDTIKVSLICF